MTSSDAPSTATATPGSDSTATTPPNKPQAVCVFLGSSFGTDPAFRAAAQATGVHAAQHDITIIYGGGLVGCMGVLAQSCMGAGGRVIGIIPKFMVDKEMAMCECTELFVVGSMHERKMKMQELAGGFLVLPGGLGTLEELFEIVTWRKLAIHNKPLVFVNTNGFYDHLFRFIQHATEAGFIAAEADSNDPWYHAVATPEEGLDLLAREIPRLAALPPQPSKALERAVMQSRS